MRHDESQVPSAERPSGAAARTGRPTRPGMDGRERVNLKVASPGRSSENVRTVVYTELLL